MTALDVLAVLAAVVAVGCLAGAAVVREFASSGDGKGAGRRRTTVLLSGVAGLSGVAWAILLVLTLLQAL